MNRSFVRRAILFGALGIAAAIPVWITLTRDDGGSIGLFGSRREGVSTATQGSEPSPDVPLPRETTGREETSASPQRTLQPPPTPDRRPDERRVLSGLVRDLFSRPIAGATVELTHRTLPELSGTATTEADGRYRIERWPSELELLGRLDRFAARIRVTADSFVPLEVKVEHEIRVDLPGDPRLDLWLTRGARLEGRVTRHEDGAPLAGALVELRNGDGHPILDRVLRGTRSATDGRYVFEAIPSRSVHASAYLFASPSRPVILQLLVRAPGFAPSTMQVEAVEEGETLELDVELVRCGRIRGRVVDLEERPHAGVRVGLFGPTAGRLRDGGEHLRPYATTGDDGRYVLDDVPLAAAQEGFVLRGWTDLAPGSHADWSEPVRVVVAPGGTIDAPDLVVPRNFSIVVRVGDEEGRPIAGASVTGNAGNTAQTDGSGRAVVLSTNAGPQRLRADAEGYVSRLSDFVEARILDPPEVAFRLPRAHAVRGRVRYADGTPASVVVLAIDGSLDEASATSALKARDLAVHALMLAQHETSGGGWFVLDGLPEVPLHVVALDWGNYADPARVLAFVPRVPVDGPLLEITLADEARTPASAAGDPTGSVTVLVRDGERPPLALESLVLHSPTGGVFGGRIEAPGRVKFGSVPFGSLTLAGRVPDRSPFELEIAISESEPNREVSVELAAAARLAGRIRDFAAMATSRAEVEAIGADGVACAASVTADGTFVVSSLRPGSTYWLALHTFDPRRHHRHWAPDDAAALVATDGELDLGTVAFVPASRVRFEWADGSRVTEPRVEVVAGDRRVALSPRSLPVHVVLPEGPLVATLTCGEGTFEAAATVDATPEMVVSFTSVR